MEGDGELDGDVVDGNFWRGRNALNDDDLFEAYGGKSPERELAEHAGNDVALEDMDSIDRLEVLMGGARRNTEQESRTTEEVQHPPGKVPWLLMAAIMTSEVVGNGVLSLPKSYARLGWIPAQLTIVVLYIVTTHTGMLIYRLRNAFPSSRSYPSLFHQILGNGGYSYASFVVYVLLYMYVSAGLLVQATSWQTAVPTLSLQDWTFIAMGISWFILQFRTMKNVGIFSIVGVITILIPVIITFGQTVAMVNSAEFPAGKTALIGDSFSEGVVAAMDIVYAFAGHVVFLELLAQIRTPTHFPRALYTSQTIVFVVYASVGTAFYAVCGDADWMTVPFTTSPVLGGGALKIVVQVFIIVHITVGIAINGNVLVRAIQNSMEPSLKHYCGDPTHTSPARREDKSIPALLWWGSWSLLTLFFCAILIIIVDRFDSFIGLTAAIAASQTTLAWPGILDIYVFHRSRTGLRGALRDIFSGFDVLCGVFALIVGLVATIHDLISQSQ